MTFNEYIKHARETLQDLEENNEPLHAEEKQLFIIRIAKLKAILDILEINGEFKN